MMRIDEVLIASRHRREMGDVAGLAASIADVGLLHPIAVRPDGVLVAGERRLRACESLGWAEIPVHIVTTVDDLYAALKAERDENTCRKPFSPTEAVAMAAAIEPYEREAARARHGARTDLQLPVSFTGSSAGAAMDKVASAVGLSRPTLTKAQAVVEAAQEEPDVFGDLPARMDSSSVDSAFKEMKRRQLSDAYQAQNPEPPAEIATYRTIVIDPPWPIEKISRDVRPAQHVIDYPTMSMDEIAALPVGTLAHTDGAHLYLWTTHKHLPAALELVRGWGFSYQCLMTWVKNVGFTPFSWMYSTEHVIYAHRGGLPLLQMGRRLDFAAPVREHSRKPDVFYDLVRECSPCPRLEMFAREARDGFILWGNEINKFEEADDE